ncbi:tetratricopeptide repeat protein [Actinopolymorpha alba]|uniref:tetratricopeptide repeat protein n=1 Tax=Actinopolymorpha alba TaxID=533267 RepID=UPI0003744979|nr:tetratricopeptide repeat protein [Actinopolymorpha alba]
MSMDPRVADRFRLAEEYLADKAPLAALETLAPVRDELPDVVAVHLLLGRAYFASAQLRRAQGAFERVLELDPSDDYARFVLGRTFERMSQYAPALAQYRLAVAMAPRPEYQQRLESLTARMSRPDVPTP